jgi:hypothetical protein
MLEITMFAKYCISVKEVLIYVLQLVFRTKGFEMLVPRQYMWGQHSRTSAKVALYLGIKKRQ